MNKVYSRKHIWIGLAIIFVLFAVLIQFVGNKGALSTSNSSSAATSAAQDGNTVPWDYRLAEGTVGDLVGGDMTILPDNQLMANDKSYATGDKVWLLQHMSATMSENEQGRASIVLSAWRPIKTYASKADAAADLERLKVQLKTKVDLIGVYKTTLGDKSRQFAVVELPSGQQVKQPIDADRYAQLKKVKQTDILLEEVHDFENYDSVYSKFRGWASS